MNRPAIGWLTAAAAISLTLDSAAIADEKAPPSNPKSVTFASFVHDPLGAATLARAGSRLTVANVGSSGGDGVHVHLPAGVTALRVHARVANEAKLPPGAYLEISSCAGSATDSVGFLRIEHMATGGYEVSGGVAGASEQWLSTYRSGSLVLREPVAAGGNAFARVPACLACGSNLNDAATPRAGDPSSFVLRWQWSKALPVVLIHRTAGADTTVVADELRLTAPSHGNTTSTLSDFYVRGRDLGELRIDAETATRQHPSSGKPK